MKKVLIVATVQSHVAQFHKGFINFLKEHDYVVHVAARNNLDEKNGLTLNEPSKIYNLPFSRSPFSTKNIKVLRQLRKIIDENNYDIIHCHTPMGGVIGRLAAKKARKKGTKVIYTAHGFHFYKGAPLVNWLLYYPIEKYLSKKTDLILTINQEDYNRASEKFKKTKVEKISGVGIDPKRFLNPPPINLFEHFSNINNPFILTVVGELNDNKNQLFLIKAMQKIIEHKPNIVLAIVGNGPNEKKYIEKIKKMNLEDNIKLLGYRRDIPSIFSESHIIVSASKREGLGLNILEGLILSKIIVASINRGHIDLIEEGVNGYLFNINDTEKFVNIVDYTYNNYITIKNKMEIVKEKTEEFLIDRINELLFLKYEDILKKDYIKDFEKKGL